MFWKSLVGSVVLVTFVGQALAAEETPKTLDWQGFLSFAGRKCDLHFTIEQVANADEPVGASVELDAVADFSSAADFIKKMAPRLDWLSFTQDEKHNRVIHVIDRRLLAVKNYALEKIVDVEFAGVPADLGWYLKRQVPRFEPKRSGDPRQMFDDHFTEVAFAAKARSIRRVLTDAVPQGCYKPLLWRTETDITENGPMTVVQFYGNKGFIEGSVQRWPWWSWLETTSESLGCTFTIETVYRAPDSPLSCPPFFGSDETFDDIDALARELTKRVPHLSVARDAKHPTVVHIIDKELLKHRDYALDRQLTIDYQGSSGGLFASLKEKGIAVGPKVFEATPKAIDGSRVDVLIKVKAKDEQVRTILTDGFQATTTKSGVLWHARTWVKDNGLRTTVEVRRTK